MTTVAITATRNVAPVEVKIHQALAVIAMNRTAPTVDTIVVGACRGGDCIAALAALALGFSVHTVVPGDRSQLCAHWTWYFSIPSERLAMAPQPHTTTSEFMPRSRGSAAYRSRNERMVELADSLLAFPDRTEQQPFSGVTMTINIARRANKPVSSVILHEST